ncbi:hypothetical protein GMO_03180 [Gluconobacter morbifer G707]|uniref:Uncharacterized protein n=1 Tax=Gluconobacter morbifer G707 TaxID=1088869 RepID=G6XFQ3_9PROT|nr:hypothetical protein GMO_03180 [Gluconobacter morbifer G707]
MNSCPANNGEQACRHSHKPFPGGKAAGADVIKWPWQKPFWFGIGIVMTATCHPVP